MLRSTTGIFALSVLLAVASGCSEPEQEIGSLPPSPEPTGPADARAGEIRGADTWKNGVVLTGTVTIAPGAVVDIEPGATVTCAEGAAILVGGELRSRAADKPVKITCASWLGLLVAKGGKLDMEGVTLENARAGITTTEGAAPSRFAQGSILSSLVPFQVGKLSSLELDRVNAVVPEKTASTDVSTSEIRGSLKATRLDYDAKSHEGISVKEGGELLVEDSTIHGKDGNDLVSAYAAKSLTLRYSVMKGAHCGVHIQGVDTFEIDHVTSEENTYGITIYGSGAGPNVVKNSNLTGFAAWIDHQGENGPITFENVFATGGEVIQGTPPTITKAPAPIAEAKPR